MNGNKGNLLTPPGFTNTMNEYLNNTTTNPVRVHEVRNTTDVNSTSSFVSAAGFWNVTNKLLSNGTSNFVLTGDISSTTTENLQNVTSNQHSANESHKAFLQIALPTIVIFGLIGNGLSFAVLKRHAKHSSFHVYLLILGVSDSLVICTGPASKYVWILRHQSSNLNSYFDDLYCTIYFHIICVLTEWSAWITLSITVDRLIAVKYPLKASSICTVKKAYMVCFVLLVILTLCHVPFICEDFVCLIPASFEYICFHIGLFFEIFTYLFIPVPIIAILNIVIGKTVIESRETRRKMMNVNASIREFATRTLPSESTVSTVLTLFLISSTFIVLSSPLIVERILLENAKLFDEQSKNLLLIIIEISLPLNHSINVFLYCVSGAKFRKRLKEIICLSSKKSENTQLASISK